MGRKRNALVIDLEEAAEMLLSTTGFIRKEIKEGQLRGIKMGNKTVVRLKELEAYLERKEEEGPPPGKSSRKKEKIPDAATNAPATVAVPSPDNGSNESDEPPAVFKMK